jgi:hypothetical protein
MMQIAVQKHGWIAIGLAVLAVATQLVPEIAENFRRRHDLLGSG